MLENLEDEMKLSLEILESMPTNNPKNIQKFDNELSKEILKYENKLEDIHSELKRRCEKYENIKFNDFSEKKQSLEMLSKALLYTTSLNTPYEKLGIDKIVYNLANYQGKNDDLDYLNKNILKIIHIFNLVGIKLNINDFKYSNPVFMYMIEFFKYKNDLTNSNLKDTFNNIYWQCPKLTLHIELCIRHLYIKNIKKFKNYIEKINNELLDKFKNREKSLIKDYAFERTEYAKLIENDRDNILYNFYQGIYDATDYEESKITSIISKYFENKTDIELNIEKVLNSLNELKGYIQYNDLIKTAVKLYNENLENDFLNKKLKEISKLENKLFCLNKKITSRHTVTKVDKNEPVAVDIINSIKAIYDEIDNSIMKIKIKKYIKENSTIFVVLLLVSYNYVLSANYFKENDDTLQTIDIKIKELLHFTLNPNNTVITNTMFLDDSDKMEIISENYRLLGINLDKNLLESELDNVISDMKKIKIYFKLKEYGISQVELENVKQSKLIIQKSIKKV